MKKCSVFLRRWKDKSGFTLTELLLTTLILLMVSAVVAAGVPAAVNAYQKVLDASNAQVLLSTTVSSLERELSFARNVKKDDNNAVQSYTSDFGKGITLETSDSGITRVWASGAEKPQLPPIVNAAIAPDGLVSKYESFKYENGVFTIEDLSVQKGASGPVLAGPVTIKIRTITGS